jgi:asparagine synthase (glutamine-hydrolysing)
MRDELFSNGLKAKLGGYNAVEVFRAHAARAETDEPLSLVQYLDLHTYLIGDINTKVDRASMAHSLEVREPLMDHPLVEWLATLPRRSRCGARKANSAEKRSSLTPGDLYGRKWLRGAARGWFRAAARARW